jgi:hypothetical protein
MTDSASGPPPEWQKPPWLKQRDGHPEYDDEPDVRGQLLPLGAVSDADYQQQILTDLLAIIAHLERVREITSMVTDMHAWGILMLRELGRIRADSDTVIRRLAVDMAKSGHMQQQEIARLTGFSRNTISAWVRKTSGQLPPEPPDDMTDPAQIDH